MKYTINVDENNFVLSIANTPNDDIELNLEELDLVHLGAYQLKKDKLVLNEKKLAELIAEEERRKEEEEKPTWQENIESQVFYTAMMTDTLIEE